MTTVVVSLRSCSLSLSAFAYGAECLVDIAHLDPINCWLFLVMYNHSAAVLLLLRKDPDMCGCHVPAEDHSNICCA